MNEREARERAKPRIGWLISITVAVWTVIPYTTWTLTRGDYYRTFPSALWVLATILVGGWSLAAWVAYADNSSAELEEVQVGDLRMAPSRPGAASLTAGPSLQELESRWHAVLGAYGAFMSDIVAIASMPLLADPTCPRTDAFQTALVLAEDAHADAQRDPARLTAYLEAVDNLERTWRDAQAYARRKGYSTFEDAERDAVRRAQRLLDIALDEHAFGPERREAMRKAVDLLRTVVEVPTQAVTAIDHRVQRLELES